MRSREPKSPGSWAKGILLPVVILLSLGTVIVYTSSSFLAHSYGLKGGQFYFLFQHMLRIIIGFLGLFFFFVVPHHLWKTLAPKIFIFTLLLLLSLFLIGKVSHGARRWIHLAFLTFQPSDLARFSLILFLAAFLTSRKRLKSFRGGFLPSLFAILLISGCVALQPDISTGFLLFVIGVAILFYAGAKILHLLFLSLSGGILLLLLLLTYPHARERIEKFRSPELNYQVIQAKIGISEGRIAGVGVGKGKEKFLYLPAPHTDFIFAVIGEELGFIGAALVILLFMMIGYYGFGLAQSLIRGDPFGSILAFGISFSFLIYAFSNIAVVLGLVPTTGLTLPFVSFGGSSLLFNLSSVGLLLSLTRGEPRGKRR